MTRSVLVTDYAWPSLEVERGILEGAGCELVAAQSGEEDELIALAGPADAILTNWKPVTARVLAQAHRCVTVARYGVGVDNIDVAAATELGMIVSNVPDYCVDEVSDHAMALVLALARRVVEFAGQTRAGAGTTRSSARCTACAAGPWASSASVASPDWSPTRRVPSDWSSSRGRRA